MESLHFGLVSLTRPEWRVVYEEKKMIVKLKRGAGYTALDLSEVKLSFLLLANKGGSEISAHGLRGYL